jgi:glucose/arabinose dehydrogenase/mono/diheme cytochrome c family protein
MNRPLSLAFSAPTEFTLAECARPRAHSAKSIGTWSYGRYILPLLWLSSLVAPAAQESPEVLRRFKQDSAAKAIAPWTDGKFTLASNDVVVFAGQMNFVLEQKAGTLEALLASAFAEQRPRFRSMAWEGDTVYEQWRDLNFGSWTSQLEAAGATAVIAQFGQVEALDGPARLPEFTAAYHRLLDQFAARTPQLVLVSPMPFEKPRQPHAPDLPARNDHLGAYVDVVRRIARERRAIFVDLFAALSKRPAGALRLTENGMHLTPEGQRIVAGLIAQELGAKVSRTADMDDLRAAISEKNRLWFDCWRPANWSFVYGDRISQLFAKSSGSAPSLAELFERHKPLISALDARIHQLARGEKAPPYVPPLPETSADTNQLSPEAELATFTMAEGYEVNLFASERDGVVKPTQISWDERGRLYVACSPTYPHILAGRKPADYVLALEDSDGDGRADKSSRVVEGLTMAQGVEPGDGGLYVCDYDQLVHFRDTNGDGRADQRRLIFSGFGVGDTHQLINSISHGPEGSLWFTQGLHAFARIETPWGLARLDRAGLWRLRPRTLRLDTFFNGAKAGHNCWGVAFDDFNQMFHKSGDRPDGYYTVPGLARISDPAEYHPLGAIFGSPSKTTGLDIIGTRALPDDVQGCAVIGDYFGNKIELHRFADKGSGFSTTLLPRPLKSSSTSFRPVDVSIGPDGAIYVADWFNPIIGHYQASYADPRRDKTHGRIWRISAKDRPRIKQPKLATMTAFELLGQLRSPERWTRYQAKRLLFDMPSESTLRAASEWIEKLSSNEADYERLLLEAIGVFEAHETPNPALLAKLLGASDPRVRAYGARVVGAWVGHLPDPLALLRERIRDSHPRVRLESIVACSYVPRSEAVEVAVQALDSPRDPFIDYALKQTVRALRPHWNRAFAEDRITFGGNAAHKDYVAKIAGDIPAEPHPGKLVYDMACLPCHQPDGKGVAGIYPPIFESDWVRGDPSALIRIVLHGLTGTITVAGKEYGGANSVPMPSFGALDDQQIADVLTYIRGSFGNSATPVTAVAVQSIRSMTEARSTPWTIAELRP